MATADSVKQKLRGLIDGANQTTGADDATLTDAVTRLRNGFGTGAVTELLTVTKNGTYIPGEGVAGFSQVDVNVSASLPSMSAPASPTEVLEGKEYIGADGTVHTGTIPVRSDVDVHLNATDITQNVNVTVDSGYYPEPITLYGTAGGNADLSTQNTNLTVGGNIFPDYNGFLPSALFFYYNMFKQGFGSGMYYMPSTCLLVMDSLLIINGAFYAESIDLSATNQVFYSGSDTTGTYQLEMVLESYSEDKLLSITLTRNGEAVDVSGIINAILMIVLPLID